MKKNFKIFWLDYKPISSFVRIVVNDKCKSCAKVLEFTFETLIENLSNRNCTEQY